ncbi:ABC transporter substrate-binding protein [Acuticoccus sp. I52.16.1]|uniref:ABC transporter substrate-binding protein n=1 Tax=Acuticoccus sp. I52.16.1 TaxID=2928472 RepID=UPI001FCFDAF4|nr:ABC transporter substrate-binding protein [Acuticoccus sp. I52.16.1]UOM37169.1 ABC transporter substrate-binding protein [Acuticoccus sp. I52.16.1]
MTISSPHRTMARLLAASALAAAPLMAAPALAQDAVKVGFVYFLSGAGAAYGDGARKAAELMVDALNEGAVPAPYDKVGINGVPLEAIYVDEAGGVRKQIAEYRRLVESEGVDMVLGYTSSSNCNALAPIVEELETLTNFFHCGNPGLFEEVDTDPFYAIRSAPMGTMDQVGLARYIAEIYPDAATFSGVNQDYSWGQDNWAEFQAAMTALKPDAAFKNALFPQLGAGDYGSEISALAADPADITFVSFWGGDADALMLQANSRGLGMSTDFAFTLGTGVINGLGQNTISGTIVGGRGPNSYLDQETELSTWFADLYQETYGAYPPLSAHVAAQGLLGVKAAAEKAADGEGALPETDAIVEAMKGLTYETTNGYPITMGLHDGNQGVSATAYGTYTGWDSETDMPIIENVTIYDAECVNPPEGVKALEWIEGGFEGASC